MDHSPAYPFGIKPEARKREDTPAPNTYKPERIVLKPGPAFTFGYKSDDPNAWANLARQISLNYSEKRRGSNASAGTYDVGEEKNNQTITETHVNGYLNGHTNGYVNGTGRFKKMLFCTLIFFLLLIFACLHLGFYLAERETTVQGSSMVTRKVVETTTITNGSSGK